MRDEYAKQVCQEFALVLSHEAFNMLMDKIGTLSDKHQYKCDCMIDQADIHCNTTDILLMWNDPDWTWYESQSDTGIFQNCLKDLRYVDLKSGNRFVNEFYLLLKGPYFADLESFGGYEENSFGLGWALGLFTNAKITNFDKHTDYE